MVVDLSQLGGQPDPEELGEDEDRGQNYQPLSMLALECALREVPIPGAPPGVGGMPWITLLYQDIGGEKMMWFPPPIASQVGDELKRLARAAASHMPVIPDGGLQVAQIDPTQVMRDLMGKQT